MYLKKNNNKRWKITSQLGLNKQSTKGKCESKISWNTYRCWETHAHTQKSPKITKPKSIINTQKTYKAKKKKQDQTNKQQTKTSTDTALKTISLEFI